MVRVDQATGTLRIPHEDILSHTIGMDLVVFEIKPGTEMEGVGTIMAGRNKVGFLRREVFFKREPTEFVIRSAE